MKTTSKTAAVMNLISRGTAPAVVDGGQMPAVQGERTIEEITQDILQAQQTGGEALLTIGRGLIEAKEKLNHGEWLDWLTERINYSPRSAQKLMKLAREWTNASTLTHLGASKAFALLAMPEDEREAFLAEPHIVDGEEKPVIDMSLRELEKAIKDREDALAAKTAAEDLMAKAIEQRDNALKELENSYDALRASDEDYDQLAQELEELKSRPVEVAVQVDQQAVEKARAEAVAEMKKKLDKINAEKDKLTAAMDEAEEKRKSAETELAAVQAKLAAAEKAGKPSVLTSDALLAQFHVLFNQADAIANQMNDLLIKIRSQDDGTVTENLEKALVALSDKIREGVA